MEAIEIQVEERAVVGSNSSIKLRKSGVVPAVVYAGGKDPQLAQVTATEFSRRISGRGTSQLFKIKSQKKGLNGQLVLVKDVQIEPIHDEILHLDFLALDESKSIRVDVPIELTGESPDVKAGEAILNQSTHSLEIECLPTEIPKVLVVDISALKLGDSVHAGEVSLPSGAKLKNDPKMPVVSIVHKREEEVAAPVAAAATAEGAAPADGAAATPADGAAKGAAPAKDAGAAKGGAKKG